MRNIYKYVWLFLFTIMIIYIPGNLFSKEEIKLSEPSYDSKTSVEEALKNRRSVREYKDTELKLKQMSQILWSAYGITKPMPNAPEFLRGGFKTAPSAGALYPLEIYLITDNVDGLMAGIYKYIPQGHKLILVKQGEYKTQLVQAAYGQDWIKQAPAILVYTAVYDRTTDKYGERGRNRYVGIDLGHSGQNVYLQCESLGLATCAVGAFDDEMVQNIVDAHKDETALYIMPLGEPKN
ncbi:MAG: SagB/ThcOx family dehydrogenase [Candidatus Cloacimonetes bacterium]|nr:SagB/ThcOx family dehydrogenase [Candidatus Cloacimonadota bacterium]